jgi:hypothetical protein
MVTFFLPPYWRFWGFCVLRCWTVLLPEASSLNWDRGVGLPSGRFTWRN